MFTGIIETIGKITSVETSGSNVTLWLESLISAELAIDQSLSHNGVCLTVEEIKGNTHRVSAIRETLKKTNLGSNQTGDLLNLERCIRLNERLDGHIVQGHVDAIAKCIERKEYAGSWEFRFQYDREFAHLVIEKGSICLNGISLTAFDVTDTAVSVAIIPYTFHNTTIGTITEGSLANVEFDMIGKYVQRWEQLKM